jgi:hypothetical protein
MSFIDNSPRRRSSYGPRGLPWPKFRRACRNLIERGTPHEKGKRLLNVVDQIEREVRTWRALESDQAIGKAGIRGQDESELRKRLRKIKETAGDAERGISALIGSLGALGAGERGKPEFKERFQLLMLDVQFQPDSEEQSDSEDRMRVMSPKAATEALAAAERASQVIAKAAALRPGPPSKDALENLFKMLRLICQDSTDVKATISWKRKRAAEESGEARKTARKQERGLFYELCLICAGQMGADLNECDRTLQKAFRHGSQAKKREIISMADLEPRLVAAGYASGARIVVGELTERIARGELDEHDAILRQPDGEIKLDYEAIKALMISGAI